MNTPNSASQQTGMTLIEVMVALAVTIILFAIAAPSLGGFLRSNRLTSTVNDFVGALNLTRSEAVRAGGATICASSDQETCNSSDWRDGWIVFSDYNASGDRDDLEPVIRAFAGLPANVEITTNSTVVTFGSRGFLNVPGATESFVFCGGDTGEGAGRAVSVNQAGRPNTEIYNGCT